MTLFSTIFSLFGCNSERPDEKKENNTHIIDTTKFYPVNSRDTLQSIYFETSKFLWLTLVPKSGQAETKQREFIRIIEKLDREIRGNAKANWDEQFILLANMLRDSLIESSTFPKEITDEIRNDIDSLTRSPDELFLDDDIYNRITRRIVEWYWRHKEPIKHSENINLKR
ncbi:MAG: hypothetical protein WBC06_13145 [Chitinophagaceae bacterium]